MIKCIPQVFGIGANLGSSLTVEMIGKSGFDWTWIDCEHGAGDYSELIPQIQAAGIYNAPAIVRIAWNDAPRFKRVLDLGAAGIMVPYVTSAREAERIMGADVVISNGLELEEALLSVLDSLDRVVWAEQCGGFDWLEIDPSSRDEPA